MFQLSETALRSPLFPAVPDCVKIRIVATDSSPSPPPNPADLFAQVYDQLRALAQRQMNAERADHTLSATALVHEAWLRLAPDREKPFSQRAHFYAAAAQAMRRILVDHARARCAGRRPTSADRRAALELSEIPDLTSADQSAGFLILDDAISRLESADPEAATVVRLRFFAGLTIEDTARTLGVSEPTVKRTWAFARAFLKETIEREP